MGSCNILRCECIPYSKFKDKIKLTKQYETTHYVTDLGNSIMIVKRGDKRVQR